MRLVATAGVAALLAGTALAQQAGQGIEDPDAATIQSSTVIKDTIEIPDVPPGTQAIEVDPAGSVAATPGAATPGPGDTEATAKVNEMVEDGTAPDAKPTENWFGCAPGTADLPEHCETEAESKVSAELPSADGVGDTTAVRDGGEGSTVRPPMPGNDAVDNLTTGVTAEPAANEPATMSVQTTPEATQPERPQELENEPDEVLTREGGTIDFEKDARVVPETDSAAQLGTDG